MCLKTSTRCLNFTNTGCARRPAGHCLSQTGVLKTKTPKTPKTLSLKNQASRPRRGPGLGLHVGLGFRLRVLGVFVFKTPYLGPR